MEVGFVRFNYTLHKIYNGIIDVVFEFRIILLHRKNKKALNSFFYIFLRRKYRHIHSNIE